MSKSARRFRYVLVNKPYGVLTQFTSSSGAQTLGDLVPISGIYPVGRLDRDSEGLLLLTDDGDLQHRLSDPRFHHPKTYWAQVEGVVTPTALERLRAGVELNDGWTRPAKVRLIDPPPAVSPRDPPIRYRASIPTSWIELTITEGRNRQVRRMTAAVGYPTLRLIRVAIGPLVLGELAPGSWREIEKPVVESHHRRSR